MSDLPTDQDPAGYLPPPPGEPVLDQCRAKSAGFGDYVDCLTAHPERCLYALGFGEGHLCLHPTRTDIVQRTQIANQAAP